MPDSSLSGGDMALVVIVLAISLAALGFAAYLVKAVLAADQGTVKMREIAQAVQEGAAAYLRRQFRTLGVFAVIVFLLLLRPARCRGRLGDPSSVGPSSSSSARSSPPRSGSSA